MLRVELADTDEGKKSFRKDEAGNPITAFKERLW